MIQRKQSLFLILAVIAYAVCLFLPIASVSASGMGADSLVYNLGVVNGDSGDSGISVSSTCLPLFLLLAVSAVISLATVFLFKNRKLQMNLCSIASLFTGLWYVDYLLMVFSIIPIPEVEGATNFQFASCLPLVALILVLMARKGVSDDEKLVRAADRIR